MPLATTSYSQALQEAYASNPAGSLLVDTLEFIHPSITAGGQPSAVRLVNNNGVLIDNGPPPIFGYSLKLEDDAPVDAGETVTFIACAFELELPSKEPDVVQDIAISFDNISELLAPYLDDAISVRADLAIIYRQYLLNESIEPQLVVSGLTATKTTTTWQRVTIQARYQDLLNHSFPGRLYEAKDFRGLLQ